MPLSNEQIERLTSAFADPCFPCNPLPFLNGLAEYVRENGTASIKSDTAKKMLWVLMGQAYSQLEIINMADEWYRLYKLHEEEVCT